MVSIDHGNGLLENADEMSDQLGSTQEHGHFLGT